MSRHGTFYERLETFKNCHINGRVTRNFVTSEGINLGHWLHYIDNIYDRLPEEKKSALHAAGYKRPVMGRPALDFAEGFRNFVLYNVDGDLAKDFIAPNGHKTGMWVQYIRRGIIKITPEEQMLLDATGFKWHSKRGPKPKQKK